MQSAAKQVGYTGQLSLVADETTSINGTNIEWEAGTIKGNKELILQEVEVLLQKHLGAIQQDEQDKQSNSEAKQKTEAIIEQISSHGAIKDAGENE